MASIRNRLTLALLALVVVVSLLAGAFTYQRVLVETSALFDYQLRQMALSLESQIPFAPELELPPSQTGTDFVVAIWDLFGHRVYLSRPGLPVINRPLLGYADLSLQGRPWRVYGLQTLDGVIEIAQPLAVRQAFARAAALRVLIPMLVLLPLLAIAAAGVVRRGLEPLRRLATEVQRRDVHSLAPVGAASLPEEVAPLVQQLNGLLARLDRAFVAQRAFIADAAHELRSPLTAVRLQLQLLDRAPDEAARGQARSALGAAVERAVHMVEQLLTLARNEPQAQPASMQALSLSEVAAQALADAHVLAESRHIELLLEGAPELRVRGDAEALRSLVRNLVDNAVRYSPPGSRVRVRVDETTQGARLEVHDSGPGIPPAERARAFDRFHRRASAPEGGCGLGLAIVKAVADRHGATVVLGDSPDGGLAVTVSFPPMTGQLGRSQGVLAQDSIAGESA